MKKLVEFAMKVALSWFYGFLVILGIVRTVFRNGFRKTFAKVHHEKPAVLSDPKYGTHGFLQLEDVRIHYVASGPEDKPLMLFVHGFPEFWFSWRYQLLEFQKDYRVVAIDLRGFGESDKPLELMEYRVQKLVEDLRQVIQALGYQRCVLVAHDWGGVVAWVFARKVPDMVEKLIIMNVPPSPVIDVMMKTNRDQLKMSWYVFFFQLPYLPEFASRIHDFAAMEHFFGTDESGLFPSEPHKMNQPWTREEIEAYKYTFSQPGALTSAINYYRCSFRNSRIKHDLDYPMPVLLIWGLKDFALHKDFPDLVKKMSPKVDVRKIPESNHFVQMDCPQIVNETMRDWLASS